MKDNDVWEEKYSSDTSERIEENDCLICLPHANERCRKLYVWKKLLTFLLLTTIVMHEGVGDTVN